MKLVTTVSQVRQQVRAWHDEGLTVALVPTMGWFHEGHLSLMRTAGHQADRVVVSLFVNPIQFGEGEDLDSYPRDLERDSEMAKTVGVDVLYSPTVDEMYPAGFQSMVRVRDLSMGLCGGSRPGHFDGVCTVVCKLFNQVEPDKAFFGEKDYQQLAIIRRMVIDLDMDVEVLGCPIVREESGLAMSSRNVHLRDEDQDASLSLMRGIDHGRKRVAAAGGSIDAAELVGEIEKQIETTPGCRVDYVRIVDCDSLVDVKTADKNSRLILAVKVADRVRLIDNGSLV